MPMKLKMKRGKGNQKSNPSFSIIYSWGKNSTCYRTSSNIYQCHIYPTMISPGLCMNHPPIKTIGQSCQEDQVPRADLLKTKIALYSIFLVIKPHIPHTTSATSMPYISARFHRGQRSIKTIGQSCREIGARGPERMKRSDNPARFQWPAGVRRMSSEMIW